MSDTISPSRDQVCFIKEYVLIWFGLGMTSEGGGAVIFPIMTLAFSIPPSVARDFSVMIRSCGMSAASFTILFMRIRCEWRALALGSLGGLIGLILGLEIIDDQFTPKEKKLGFVSIWFAFSSVLLFQIVFRRGKTYNSIQGFNWWKALVLFSTGCVGGIFNGVVGNGLDICTFSVLTLLFRVSEKIATPTSVLLMALNSVVAVYWRGVMLAAITQEAWEFSAVCIPSVVIGAPIGSILGSHLHRIVLAGLVIFLDTLALIGAYVILPMSLMMGMVLGGIIIGSVGFFGCVAYVGYRLQNQLENKIANFRNMVVVEEDGSHQTDKKDGNSNDLLVEMKDLESRDSNGCRAETLNEMVTRDSDGHPIRISDIGSRDHESSNEPMKRHVPLAQRLINRSST